MRATGGAEAERWVAIESGGSSRAERSEALELCVGGGAGATLGGRAPHLNASE